jgi:hypothetical protein
MLTSHPSQATITRLLHPRPAITAMHQLIDTCHMWRTSGTKIKSGREETYLRTLNPALHFTNMGTEAAYPRFQTAWKQYREQRSGLPTRHVYRLGWMVAIEGTKILSSVYWVSHCFTPWVWVWTTHCTLSASTQKASLAMWGEISTQPQRFFPGRCTKRILRGPSILTIPLPLLSWNLINHVCIWIQTRQ